MNGEQPQFRTAGEFLQQLFEEEFTDEEVYDKEVVGLVKKHLSGENVHSKAGSRLAAELIQLAKSRVPNASQ